MLRRVAIGLTFVVSASGCWMFSALGDFPVPGDGGAASHDASADSERDATDARRDGAHDGSVTGSDARPRDSGSLEDTSVPDASAPTDGDAADSAPVIVPAFYVSTTGKATNPGTLAEPFGALQQAEAAMMASATVKTTYIRAGSYTFASSDGGGAPGLSLAAGDDGETWSYYPPDGVDSADFSGGATSGGDGVQIGISVGAQGVTINGISLHNFRYAAIASGGGDDGLIVENNVIYDVYGTGEGNPAAFSSYGGESITISHNLIHDIADFGLSFTSVNGDISHLSITENVFYNTCTGATDCGAIYLWDSPATSTDIRCTNNYIHDGNASASATSSFGSALYAASCLSNLTVSGNVIAGRNGANTILVQGGANVLVTGNLTDMSTFGAAIAAFQTFTGPTCTSSTMVGNEYEHNLVIGMGGGQGYAQVGGAPDTPPTIQDNDYYSYGIPKIATSGVYADSNPRIQDPLLTGWTYDMAAGSSAVSPPVSFPPLVRGWGPPGYVIPQDAGTPPSCPL